MAPSNEQRAAMLAGVLVGLGCAAKYTSIGILLGMAFVVWWKRKSFRSLSVYGISFLITLAPYLLKNWVLTGNPVYPFLFPGKFWDPARGLWYRRGGTGLGLLQLLMAPWEATIWGVEGGAVLGHPSYGATVGPLLLTLIPFAAIPNGSHPRREKETMRAVLILCGVFYLQWLIMLAYSTLLIQTRILFPILPFLALLAAAGFDRLKHAIGPRFNPQFVLGALIGLSFFLTALSGGMSLIQDATLPVVAGFQSRADYLVSRLGQYMLAIHEINRLPEGARVMFLWEPRSFYCDRHVICEPDALLDRWWHSRQGNHEWGEIALRWKEQGAGYVLINWAGAKAVQEAGFDPIAPSDWSELAKMVDGGLVLVWGSEEGYELYALR